MKLSAFTVSLSVGVLCWGSAATLTAQNKSSFSDTDIEMSEARLTLESAAADNEHLREQVAQLRKTVAALTESLGVAQSEAEVFKREATEMKLRMEALGVDGVSSDRSKVEQRLLRATSDLRIAEAEKQLLSEQLIRITEAVMVFLKTVESGDPETRLNLEAELRSTNQALGVVPESMPTGVAVPATLQDGMVISIKNEFSLVIANIGSRQGVRIGMPFQVWRGNDQIGVVRVVDVREKISGAVVQNLKSERVKVQVGDRLRVDAQQ